MAVSCVLQMQGDNSYKFFRSQQKKKKENPNTSRVVGFLPSQALADYLLHWSKVGGIFIHI